MKFYELILAAESHIQIWKSFLDENLPRHRKTKLAQHVPQL